MLITPATAAAQQQTPPQPPGNRIVAQDGDVVIVEGRRLRVRIVRSRRASVRVVFDEAERWLLLLVDQAAAG